MTHFFETAQNGQLIYLDIPQPSIKTTNTPRSNSSTGYGDKLPTRYMVRTTDNRWRRVYARCFSNVASLYVIENGKRYLVNLLGE